MSLRAHSIVGSTSAFSFCQGGSHAARIVPKLRHGAEIQMLACKVHNCRKVTLLGSKSILNKTFICITLKIPTRRHVEDVESRTAWL